MPSALSRMRIKLRVVWPFRTVTDLPRGCTGEPVSWYVSNEGKMKTSSDYQLSSTAQLRSIIGDPGELVPKKVMHALDEMAADFIRRSPFLVLATTDAAGNLDASPKGGGPGFVAIEDDLTLAIPDRKGNKLIFGLQNILANPHVGLIFIIQAPTRHLESMARPS